jgi:hypothetical protein
MSPDFEVPLQRFSRELTKDVFMRIEQPEKPLGFPVHAAAAPGAEPPHTIGEFYRRLRRIFEDQPGLIQVTTGQPVSSTFEGAYSVKQTIQSSEDAVKAIDFIVGQGEGTETDPVFDGADEVPDNDALAHYYRFAEIVQGRLKRNPSPPPDPKPEDLYFYDAGDPVPFDAAAVLPVRDNARSADFAPDSDARRTMNEFNRIYTGILEALDAAFNVDAGRLDDAIGLMYDLTTAAMDVVRVDLGDGTRPGPSFEFLPS